jgi:hypothetical protein
LNLKSTLNLLCQAFFVTNLYSLGEIKTAQDIQNAPDPATRTKAIEDCILAYQRIYSDQQQLRQDREAKIRKRLHKEEGKLHPLCFN